MSLKIYAVSRKKETDGKFGGNMGKYNNCNKISDSAADIA